MNEQNNECFKPLHIQVTTSFYLNHVCPANQKGDVISPTQTASIKLRSITTNLLKSLKPCWKPFENRDRSAMAKKSF